MKRKNATRRNSKSAQKKSNGKAFAVCASVFVLALSAIVVLSRPVNENVTLTSANFKRTDIPLMKTCQDLSGGHPISALSVFMKNYEHKILRIPGDPIAEVIFKDSTGRCRVYTDGPIIIGRNFMAHTAPIRISQY